MNTKILQKCLDELNKEKPDISYVKGMLETLADLSGGSAGASLASYYRPAVVSNLSTPADMDEGGILDATARASIETIQILTDKSLEQ